MPVKRKIPGINYVFYSFVVFCFNNLSKALKISSVSHFFTVFITWKLNVFNWVSFCQKSYILLILEYVPEDRSFKGKNFSLKTNGINFKICYSRRSLLDHNLTSSFAGTFDRNDTWSLKTRHKSVQGSRDGVRILYISTDRKSNLNRRTD